MLHIKNHRKLFTVILFWIAVNSFGQTFSQLSENSLPNLYQHLLVSESRILTVGWTYIQSDDVFNLITEVRVRDISGELITSSQYYSTDWFWDPAQNCNTILNDTMFAIGIIRTKSDNDTVLNSIVQINQDGDTSNIEDFTSPYFFVGEIPTYHHVPASIVYDTLNQNFYFASRIVDSPPIQNNFIIRKINSQGEVVWTYINPLDEWYFSVNDLAFRNDTLWFISIASGNQNHFNKLIGLSASTGELVYEVEHLAQNLPVGGCSDMYLTDQGPVIATTIGDNDGTLPFLYKMDFYGNYLWYCQPEGDFGNWQTNDHIVPSQDNGFVSCGVKYDEDPSWLYPNDPAMKNTMKRIWLWKVDANGNFLWQRFYSYYDFDYSSEYFHLTNIAHDMKATPDGGFIMAGEASASCTDYPDCDNFTQQGWLLKVDACGCLVPGCDPNCIVSVEETEVGNEKKYFRFGPNPVGETLNIFLASDEHINLDHATLEVHDLMGRLIRSLPLPHNNTTYIIDAQSLTAGNYFLTLTKDGQVLQSEKMVRE